MAEHLFLRLLDSDNAEWLLLDETSGIVRFRGRGDFNDLESMAQEMVWAGRTHVLVPGEAVLLTRAVVPSKQMRQVLQAVPFMVEEQLASDIDDCHFAVGERVDGGAVRVAVVDRQRLGNWLDRLAAAGVRPSTMTADVEHAGRDAAGSRVLIDGDRALLVTGDAAMAVELDTLPTALQLAGEAALPVTISVPEASVERVSMYSTQIEAELGAVEVEELDYSAFEVLCRQFSPRAIDLLQGEFRVDEKRQQRKSPWPAVATLAACAFGLHIMLLVVQGIYLDVKATQYENEARALYAEVFPNDRNVRDLRRRWQSRIRAGSGQGGDQFIEVFAQASQQVATSSLRLENINFNESRGDISLQLLARQSSEFVSFSRSLTDAGIDAEVGTINQVDDGARGNIRIRVSP